MKHPSKKIEGYGGSVWESNVRAHGISRTCWNSEEPSGSERNKQKSLLLP
jgi:hypothetical protein